MAGTLSKADKLALVNLLPVSNQELYLVLGERALGREEEIIAIIR